MKITRNRLHSPKGRAAVLREWLRLLTLQKYEKYDVKTSYFAIFTFLTRWQNSRRAKLGEYDFSHDVQMAMLSCLACKACATECPVGVDIASLRAHFLQLYYTRYLHPLGDYIVANIERCVPLMTRAPAMVNHFLGYKKVASLIEKLSAMVDLPALSVPTLTKRIPNYLVTKRVFDQLKALTPSLRNDYVFILQDAFTSCYEAQLIVDLTLVIEKLGFKPLLLPFTANGKPQYISGFLSQFITTATKAANYLNQINQLAIPIIGVDPAMVFSYRHEYNQMLGDKRGDFNVLLLQEWLQHAIKTRELRPLNDEPLYLLTHCTEASTQPNAITQWQTVFHHIGVPLHHVKTSCCGMAGTFGHLKSNQSDSRGIYALSWQRALKELPHKRCLATGYSCRSQVKRIDDLSLRHPLQALLELL